MRQRPIPLRAVTIDTAKHNENGRDLFRKAELQGRHASSNHTTASNLLDLQGETDTNIQAGEQFRLSSCQLDAAKAYQKAALLVSSEKLNKQERAALLYTEAALCLDKLDSSLAVAPFSQAVSQYCQASKYENAAATEERIARIHETNSQWESSVKHYQRAAKPTTCPKERHVYSKRMENTWKHPGSTETWPSLVQVETCIDLTCHFMYSKAGSFCWHREGILRKSETSPRKHAHVLGSSAF